MDMLPKKKRSFNFRIMCLWTSVVNDLVLLSSVVICLQLYMTGCVCVCMAVCTCLHVVYCCASVCREMQISL